MAKEPTERISILAKLRARPSLVPPPQPKRPRVKKLPEETVAPTDASVAPAPEKPAPAAPATPAAEPLPTTTPEILAVPSKYPAVAAALSAMVEGKDHAAVSAGFAAMRMTITPQRLAQLLKGADLPTSMEQMAFSQDQPHALQERFRIALREAQPEKFR